MSETWPAFSPRLKALIRPAVILLLTAGHCLVVWLMLSRQLDWLFNDARHRLGPGTDFATYYEAGAAFLSGRGIYDSGPGFGYRYHPFFALSLGAWLARLPLPLAYALWAGLMEALLLAVLWILRSWISSDRRYAFLALTVLAYSPYYLELYMGNATFVAASILLLAWYQLRHGRRILFTALFCASLLVKPIGLILVPLLLMQRRFAEVAGSLTAIALLAVPYFLLHPGDLGAMVRANVRGDVPGWLVHAGNQGFHGLLGALMTRGSGIPTWQLSSYAQLPSPARLVMIAAPVLILAAALRAGWFLRKRTGDGVLLWSCVYLLAFPDVWEHSYCVLVLGIGMAVAEGGIARGILFPCAVLAAMPTAFALYDLRLPPGPYDPEHGWRAAVSLLHHATKPLPVAVLFGTLLWTAERLRRVARLGRGLRLEPAGAAAEPARLAS